MEVFSSPQFLAALLAFVTGLAALYWKFKRDTAEFRKSETEVRNAELSRAEKRIAKKDRKIEILEEENDGYRLVALALRDENSKYRTLLYNHGIEIPEPRRRGDMTHPVDEMLDNLNDKHKKRNGENKEETE